VEIRPSHLNPTDAALWDIERDPMLRTTIVAAMVLDRPVDHRWLTDTLEIVTRRVPRLRQRVVANIAGVGTPRWELDPGFDLADHVRIVPVDGVVDEAAIAGVAEPMASTPFDRHRPLWEVAYLDPPTGRAAAVFKVHHSLTDGVGGIGLLDEMLDRRPRIDRPDLSTVPVPVPARRPPPGIDERGALVRRGLAVPWSVAEAATTATFHPLRTTRDLIDGVGSARRLLAPSDAPLSPVLTDRGTDRRVGVGEFDLGRLRGAAKRHDCTVNHAFFAGVVGGIAEYHRALGSDVASLRVTMPVNVRTKRDGQAGNRWAPVRMVVPADIDDPVERMAAMRSLVVASRQERALGFSQTLAGIVQMLPAAVSSTVVAGMMRGVDATLTNVPGLTEPHYLAGAAVERMFAFAPTGGAALTVSLMSHLGTACIGVVSDVAAVADPDLMTSSIIAGIDELIAAAER
jgi:WS/DGAT/MGAT family acyltransferase